MATRKEFENYCNYCIKLCNVISERKKQIGWKNPNNFSTKSIYILTEMLINFEKTNSFTASFTIDELKTILKADNAKHIARDLTVYFSDYGLGDCKRIKNDKLYYTLTVNNETQKLLLKNQIITESDN